MSPIGALVLLVMFAKAKPGTAMVPASTARKAVKGKSGTTWHVIDSNIRTKAGATVPARDVFASATGQDRVLSFALMPGGIRAWTFKAPSSLTAKAMSDFDVQDIRAAV